MQIRDHKITIEFILHFNIVPDGAEVIAQVQKAGRPDTTHYYFFLFSHKEDEDNKTDLRIAQNAAELLPCLPRITRHSARGVFPLNIPAIQVNIGHI